MSMIKWFCLRPQLMSDKPLTLLAVMAILGHNDWNGSLWIIQFSCHVRILRERICVSLVATLNPLNQLINNSSIMRSDKLKSRNNNCYHWSTIIMFTLNTFTTFMDACDPLKIVSCKNQSNLCTAFSNGFVYVEC